MTLLAADALAAFRKAESEASPFGELMATDEYFNAACAAGEVAPLTLDQADLVLAPEDAAARIAAVRDRLRRLGYALPEVAVEQRGLWDVEVRAGLRQFQIEAGLAERSGELTVEAWDSLQALFNFETRLRVGDWWGTGGAEEPLRRAVRLRLSVLGFGVPPTNAAYAPSAAALGGFLAVVRALGVDGQVVGDAATGGGGERGATVSGSAGRLALPQEGGGLAAELTPGVAELLFGHDALADRLAECGARLAALTGKERAQAEHFLVCFAKVELWLHGYDVVPDGSSRLTQPGVRARRAGPAVERANVTADQFNLFFEELAPEGMSVRSATPAAIPGRVPELLRRMRELRAEQPLTKDAASREVVGLLEAELAKTPTLWAELKATAGKLVGILFDGVRRVLAWIGRLFARAWSAVSTAAVNLWRAVQHFMGGAAFYFRKAARALCEGAAFLVNPGLASAPVCCAGYSRRVDFDAGLLIDDAAEEAEVGVFARGLARKGAVLAVACRIIRLVCTAVRIAVRGAAGAVGGFVPMVLGLASAWSQLRELGRMLDELPE